jgi:hypothetical protein
MFLACMSMVWYAVLTPTRIIRAGSEIPALPLTRLFKSNSSAVALAKADGRTVSKREVQVPFFLHSLPGLLG